MADPKWLTKI